MPSCNSCNAEFNDEAEQKLHFKSEWHRYNLKRKVAGVPGVTEPLFLARQSALAQENKSDEVQMLYSCGLCSKSYRSSKAHAQHLNSRTHLSRLSQGTGDEDENSVIIRALPPRAEKGNENKPSRDQVLDSDEESEESEWEVIDADEDLVSETRDSLMQLKVKEDASTGNDEHGDNVEMLEGLNPSCCLMCDLELKTVENCMVHMHKHHGFFVPDVEYLKDPEGLLTYLGLKVKRDFLCLYCSDNCHPFSSLEAVRKHMVAKSHCKVRYGDGGDDEEAELEDFYDYSSSYMDVDGNQLVTTNDMNGDVELGIGGSELIISKRTHDGKSSKTLGSREFLRYYRQKPRPTAANDVAIKAVLASRYRSMGLATVQSKEHIVKMKSLKAMNRSNVDNMRTKIAMKSNVIRNLPRNETH